MDANTNLVHPNCENSENSEGNGGNGGNGCAMCEGYIMATQLQELKSVGDGMFVVPQLYEEMMEKEKIAKERREKKKVKKAKTERRLRSLEKKVLRLSQEVATLKKKEESDLPVGCAPRTGMFVGPKECTPKTKPIPRPSVVPHEAQRPTQRPTQRPMLREPPVFIHSPSSMFVAPIFARPQMYPVTALNPPSPNSKKQKK